MSEAIEELASSALYYIFVVIFIVLSILALFLLWIKSCFL